MSDFWYHDESRREASQQREIDHLEQGSRTANWFAFEDDRKLPEFDYTFDWRAD